MLADAYDPPSNYYSTAVGLTGTTLKQQLHALIDAVDDPNITSQQGEVVETPMSYDAVRSSLQVTDADPNSAGHMLTVYDRTSVNVAAINPHGSIPGWDSGATWNREHTWPQSRGVLDTGPDTGDLFELRPSLTVNNGDRGNANYGGAFGHAAGMVTDNGNQMWYPGDADAGMIAREEFYMAVRYDGTESNTTNLELQTGNPSTSLGLGDLNRMIEWHFAAPPDSFERNRNQVIFTQFQHNRDPFIDHPEYVWSVFVNQTNDSQISIAGTTVNSDGSSAKTVNLGSVIVGGAVPAPQLFTLNKSGNNGTYFQVSTDTNGFSPSVGRFNAFRTNQTDSKSISVGLQSGIGLTATAGMQTGTVTIDNLDITTGYDPGATRGHGGKDDNDTFTVNLNVLDHSTPSFASPTLTTSRTLDFGNIALGSSSPTINFDVFNLTGLAGYTAALDLDSVTPSGNISAFTTNLASFSSLAAGSSHAFTSSLNVTSVGTFTAFYTLNLSDENLVGATNKSLTLMLTGKVHLAGDFNGDGVVNSGDYLVWRRTFGQTGVTAYSGADGDGDTTIDDADFDVWRTHFGQTASGSGSGSGLSATASVPEPASVTLLAIAALVACHCLQRFK